MRNVSLQQSIWFLICKISDIGYASPVWTVLVTWYPRLWLCWVIIVYQHSIGISFVIPLKRHCIYCRHSCWNLIGRNIHIILASKMWHQRCQKQNKALLLPSKLILVRIPHVSMVRAFLFSYLNVKTSFVTYTRLNKPVRSFDLVNDWREILI